ncbi:MAG: AraC family transcriptional regulator [Tenuifilaceae bacterium]|jgi:AraC-like DNA-binding protein|nr:AraC family transcriptional regulator [Tenuifilaceae bacterium]
METLTWVGFSQGLFAAIIMLAKRNRSVSDKLLTAWLFLLAIEFLSCALDYTFFGYPLLSSSFLLFNPAFYLYVQSLIDVKFRLKWIQLLHISPFIFFESFAYILHEPFMMENFLDFNTTFWFRWLFSLASVLSWITYNLVTAITLYQHRKRLVNEFSNIESNKRVGWLLFVVFFYNLYCFAAIAIALASVFVDIGVPLSPIYNYSAMLLMVYILGFYGLQQQVIFREPDIENEKSEKYSQSILSAERKVEIKENLEKYFRLKKPYLNPELSMDMISEALGFPKYQITEVLNMDIGKNFFQYVNEFRVDEVKKMLKKPNNPYSIEAIGYECGFSSKSSFFTVFKRLTGLTPQQFRNASS